MGWLSQTSDSLMPITSVGGNTLPLTDARGYLVPDAARIVHAFMFFPDDPVTAWSYVEVMKLVSDSDSADFKSEEPRVVKLLSHAVKSALQQTQIAGLIGQTLLSGSIHGGPLSLRRAIYLVQQRIDEDRSLGRRFPRDEKNLRRAFARFEPSIHFFLAMLLTPEEHWNKVDRDPISLRLFLSAAVNMQSLFKTKAQPPNWRPWLVDPRLAVDVQILTIRELSAAAKQYALKYRANPDRL